MIRPMISIILTVLAVSSCKQPDSNPHTFSRVDIQSIFEDSLLNVRAITLNNTELVAVSSIGDVFRFNLDQNNIFKHRFFSDSLNIRSLALVKNDLFTMSIGSPALLHKNSELVYSESHPDAFYDSMAFWNRDEGIAMGDPTEDCLSILITRDGGQHWDKISCSKLPKVMEGEAAFAASDTNIKILGNRVWIASGGTASRIFYSPDKGNSWTVFKTPIVQGMPTAGLYSIDFYDSNNGIGIGGDYTQPKAKLNTAILTKNGGKTWSAVDQETSPGYRSCVQYIPNSEARGVVAVGFEGIDYSADGGQTWNSLSKEGFYTIRFLNDSIAFAAGRGRISKLIFKK